METPGNRPAFHMAPEPPIDTIWLPMAPQMEAIWIPKVVDFRSHENLDLGDPSHSLEGSSESNVEAFCTLFQLLSRASVERSPGHTFWQILDPFGNPKWFQNVPKITPKPSHEYNVDPKSPSGRPGEPPGPQNDAPEKSTGANCRCFGRFGSLVSTPNGTPN